MAKGFNKGTLMIMFTYASDCSNQSDRAALDQDQGLGMFVLDAIIGAKITAVEALLLEK